MTGPENERLAVVETKVDTVVKRLDGLDSKVDLLVLRSAGWSGTTAFLRSLPPFVAVGVSIAALITALAG